LHWLTASHTSDHREEVSKARLNKIRGVEHHERVDEALYHDYETEEQRRVGGGAGDAGRLHIAG
jgi:hypothetical protein